MRSQLTKPEVNDWIEEDEWRLEKVLKGYDQSCDQTKENRIKGKSEQPTPCRPITGAPHRRADASSTRFRLHSLR